MRNKRKEPERSLPECLKRLVPEEDQTSYIEYYHLQSTRAIRKLLAEELENRINTAVLSSERNERYDLEAWAEFQASNIGYRKALREAY